MTDTRGTGRRLTPLLLLMLAVCMLCCANVSAADRYIMIGDSYSARRSGTNYDGTKEKLTKAWPDYVAEGLSLSGKTIARGNGYGFVVPGRQFITLLNGIKSDKRVTKILVAGGIGNDYAAARATKSQIRSCMKAFGQKASKKFPNAKILYAGINWGTKESRQSYCRKRAEWYKEISLSLGWTYLTGTENALRLNSSVIKKYFFNDAIHPNRKGQVRIANAMLTQLRRLAAGTAASQTVKKSPVLLAKMKSVSKTGITVSWNKIAGASYYTVHGAKCGAALKELKSATTRLTYKGTGLKAGTYYRYRIAAYDKSGRRLAVSRVLHIVTAGGKRYTNCSSVSLDRTSATLKKGASLQLKVTQKFYSSTKKAAVHEAVKYVADTPAVASVSASGKITAKSRGLCIVYAIAQNGLYARIKISVK